MKTLIVKYLNGTINKEDEETLRRWLQDPENQRVFSDFVKIQYHLDYMTSGIEETEAYNDVIAKIQIKNTEKLKKRNNIVFLMIAAAFIGGLVINSVLFKQDKLIEPIEALSEITLTLEDGSIQTLYVDQEKEVTREDGSYVSKQNREELLYDSVRKGDKKELVFNTLSVPNGKTFKLKLSDGTSVVLNSGSKLKYPIYFSDPQQRKVFLEGEAYFEVVTNAEKPFIVETKDISVTALGTGFNVTSYPNDGQCCAVLLHGKVEVQDNKKQNKKIILAPNQAANYRSNQLILENVDPSNYVSWITGGLWFINDAMPIVFNKIERKYDVRIISEYRGLDDIVLSAKFSKESLEDILKTLKAYKEFDYTITNNTIYITNAKSKI
ncbi:FecR domain-containing protein [Myroides odoratimimus]|uniref:FecR family protein n=1 Tax=Myroides odoratimimus TaxID=76832 RepID=UPI002577208E|nr:FecR domain-containing protein [Myroides odoratimimus]MDM1468638.1 FecR domain-containing protein [Myroides odoratimimus]MDM1471937.1 FecR domain-containing protein [Myroides odoratimimus]MDM1481958.1 FecR domain-containing protein [Myroides odoratimimus]MDM1485155.1 FecR domain-containing protein [Myroides odoratimimus]MEC4043943.1 FecR domain-containing protein [Myroides odoratimimus]